MIRRWSRHISATVGEVPPPFIRSSLSPVPQSPVTFPITSHFPRSPGRRTVTRPILDRSPTSLMLLHFQMHSHSTRLRPVNSLPCLPSGLPVHDVASIGYSWRQSMRFADTSDGSRASLPWQDGSVFVSPPKLERLPTRSPLRAWSSMPASAAGSAMPIRLLIDGDYGFRN